MPVIHCDYLVLGSGLAGMVFALDVADKGQVILVTKDTLFTSNTSRAQGGIAAVTHQDDSVEKHIHDTMVAGAYLCDREAVRVCATDGAAAIEHLVKMGVDFTRSDDGAGFDLHQEGGHSNRRVLHVDDATGAAIQQAMMQRVMEHPNIEVMEHHLAVDLILKRRITHNPEDRTILGAYVLERASGEVKTIAAPITLLASGGAGKVYLYTSNPDVATGDGIAIAHRAGVRVANMEFYQFHPTCLYHPKAKSFLISEALRGEGGILRLPGGERFMPRYHERAELAPRDIVARAIDQEMKINGLDHVYLDMSAKSPEFVQERFPNIHAKCLQFGIDISREPIPVVPAAHYMCGGVMTDLNGQTELSGLFAAGEVAYTGLHGANRLASNSLLEAIVFSRRAAKTATAMLPERVKDSLLKTVPVWDKGRAVPADEQVIIQQTWEEVRRFMWNFVGIVRSNHRLERAKTRIDLIRREVATDYWKYTLTADLVELRSIVHVADLIIQSAWMRKESRGLHCSQNYPYKDDERFLKPTVL